MSRLVGKNKIDEIIRTSVDKVCQMIDEQMQQSPGSSPTIIKTQKS